MSIVKISNVIPPTVEPVPVVTTWANGTDEEIASMIAAADRGEIDLTEYWHVGDERTVSLSAITHSTPNISEDQPAQDVVFVLVAADSGVTDNTNPCYKYQYKVPTEGRTYPSFIVAQKSHLSAYGVITTAQNTGIGAQGWNGTPRRTWCNNEYRLALPLTFRSIFKQVILRQATSANIMQSSDGDYFFLPTEKEMIGSRTYSPSNEADEFPQWEYYMDVNNRKALTTRWLRSAENGAADYWTALAAAGSIDDGRPWGSNAIKPCGCI